MVKKTLSILSLLGMPIFSGPFNQQAGIDQSRNPTQMVHYVMAPERPMAHGVPANGFLGYQQFPAAIPFQGYIMVATPILTQQPPRGFFPAQTSALGTIAEDQPLLSVEVEGTSTSSSDTRKPKAASRMRNKKIERSSENGLLKEVYSAVSGNRLEVNNDYIGGYKRAAVVEALREAISTGSDTAVIKETIIGELCSKLILSRDPERNITEVKILKQPQTWLEVIDQIYEAIIKRRQREIDGGAIPKLAANLGEVTNCKTFRGFLAYIVKKVISEIDETKIDNNIKEIDKELEETFCETLGVYQEDQLTDELLEGYLASIDTGYHEGSFEYFFIPLSLIDPIEQILKPQVKFDSEGMPYGSYLSLKLTESIARLMKTISQDPNRPEGAFVVGFPVWLQKLLQTTIPSADGIAIFHDEYKARYEDTGKSEGKHPFLRIFNNTPYDSVNATLSAHPDYFSEAEKDMISSFSKFLSRNGTTSEKELMALAFRALCLIRDLKEFNSQLDLNKDNLKIKDFISEMKQRHITQFIEQVDSIPSLGRKLINEVVPSVRKVPELKEFFSNEPASYEKVD